MKGRSTALVVLTLELLLACSFPAWAQVGASSAQLNGTVLDESGGAVTKAPVSLREMSTNQSYSASTNDSGYYVLPNVTPGRYELKVSFQGFSTYTQSGIVLTVGQTATITSP